MRFMYRNLAGKLTIMFQSQMDEHFLYNTLNSYIALRQRKSNPDSGYGLYARDFQVQPGREGYDNVGEVEQTIKLYLSIQKIRFNDRLDYHIHVDTARIACKQVYLPAIVENAIIH